MGRTDGIYEAPVLCDQSNDGMLEAKPGDNVADCHPPASSPQHAPQHFHGMQRLAPCSVVDLVSAAGAGCADHGAGARADSTSNSSILMLISSALNC